MKNYFLLVLVILILVSVDHPSIAKPRQEIYNQFMTFLGDSSKVQTEQAAKRALERATKRLRLSQTAQDYLNSQLETNDKMAQFDRRFCKDRELNSYFYGDDLRQICKIISEEK